MALTDTLKLRAKAGKLGIKGYKAMSFQELEKAIAKTSANGASTKTAAKSAVKTATKTAVKKTASVKSAPAKKSTAKRPTAGATKSTAKAAPAKRGRPPGSKNKGGSKAVARVPGGNGGRHLIDNKAINWAAEWSGGAQRGVRKEIFKALKKSKGNTGKTFELLKDRAAEFFPKNKRSGERYKKDRQIALLKWTISRVKFDFVVATGQHTISKKFGTLGTGKGTGAAKKSSKTKTAAKSTPKPAAAKKGTGRGRGRPPGSKNKPKATTARKSAKK